MNNADAIKIQDSVFRLKGKLAFAVFMSQVNENEFSLRDYVFNLVPFLSVIFISKTC